MTTFVLIHGSWHTGEAWYKVVRKLEAQGAAVYAPTLSGMESRENPGGPEIGLSTHIQDIVKLVEDHDLWEMVLVGHSYSGLIITGVADRLPQRVSKLVYLDAFIPENNQSLFDVMGAETEANMRAGLVNAQGQSREDGADKVWLLPPGDAAFYLGEGADPADVAWLQARLVYKPVETFAEKIQLSDVAALRAIPSAYLQCVQFPYLSWVADKARELGWPVYQIESGHDAMVTAPSQVVDILLKVGK